MESHKEVGIKEAGVEWEQWIFCVCRHVTSCHRYRTGQDRTTHMAEGHCLDLFTASCFCADKNSKGHFSNPHIWVLFGFRAVTLTDSEIHWLPHHSRHAYPNPKGILTLTLFTSMSAHRTKWTGCDRSHKPSAPASPLTILSEGQIKPSLPLAKQIVVQLWSNLTRYSI